MLKSGMNMKIYPVILFVLVFCTLSFAEQETFEKREIDCLEMAKEANRSYIQAIKEAEKSQPFDKTKAEAANDRIYNLLMSNTQRCLATPGFVTQLVYFDLSHEKPELALKHVNAALLTEPEEAALLMTKAEVLFELGRDEEALRLMERSYANADSNTAIMHRYCGMLVEHQKWRRAVDVCTETIEACKKSSRKNDKMILPWAYSSRASAYSALDKKKEAMADVKKAKDLGLSQPWFWPEELQTEK